MITFENMTNEIKYPKGYHCAVHLDNYLIIFGGHFQKIEGILHKFESTRIIRMYNLYTEQWKEHIIPDTSDAPPPFSGAVAAAIDGSIYTFGGCDTNCAITNHDLWKLRRTKREGFTWSLAATQCKEKSPSPRVMHTGCGYAGKLWLFGGEGPSPEGYLNDHGDLIELQDGNVYNNQLLCYDPYTCEWANPECFGDVPLPDLCHGGTIIKDKVWCTVDSNLFELTMHSLTWTRLKVEIGKYKEQNRSNYTLTATSDYQLIFHGGRYRYWAFSETWILDLTSHTWRLYTSGKDHGRYWNTGSSGLSNNVIIIGGFKDDGDTYKVYNEVSHVMLEPKCLQQLAIQIIYKHQDEIPWEILPSKLISRFGISAKGKDQDDHAGPECTM